MSGAEIIVGVSGGVDSSVAALLLRDAGMQVAGLFMRNWAEANDPHCRADDDRRDAVAVCGKLGIPLHFRDFSSEYHAQVFTHFLHEYAAGRTPNPDVLCNREVKFKHFLDAAMALGATRIATGHYARVDCAEGRWRLLRAVDTNKDQTYFLHQLGQTQLAATLFPLGELPKPEVRRMASAAGLATAAKKDSTGICFIGERDFRQFLSQYLPMQPGKIVTPEGHELGMHQGVFFHTIGQRGGLGLGGVRGYPDAPWYVVAKDVARNTLTVAQGVDSRYLFSRQLHSEAMHWVGGTAPEPTFECSAQVRHRQPPQPCRVQVRDNGTAHVEFVEPQRAVTPGQSVVLYDGDECLGGAVIAATDAPLEPEFHP